MRFKNITHFFYNDKQQLKVNVLQRQEKESSSTL